jgi:hypothetical protein
MLFLRAFAAFVAAAGASALLEPLNVQAPDVEVYTITMTSMVCSETVVLATPTATGPSGAIATYLPAVHWDTNLTDLANLNPSDIDLLYYTDSGVAGMFFAIELLSPLLTCSKRSVRRAFLCIPECQLCSSGCCPRTF